MGLYEMWSCLKSSSSESRVEPRDVKRRGSNIFSLPSTVESNILGRVARAHPELREAAVLGFWRPVKQGRTELKSRPCLKIWKA